MKNLDTKKKIAARVLKCSPKKVVLNTESLDRINDAITRADIKSLVSSSIITKEKDKGISRFRAKKRALQKKKGRQRGQGLRKGKATARLPAKETWMYKIRSQRKLLNSLKESEVISDSVFRNLYLKAKGGFFRSKRHIKLYINERELVNKKE